MLKFYRSKIKWKRMRKKISGNFRHRKLEGLSTQIIAVGYRISNLQRRIVWDLDLEGIWQVSINTLNTAITVLLQPSLNLEQMILKVSCGLKIDRCRAFSIKTMTIYTSFR